MFLSGVLVAAVLSVAGAPSVETGRAAVVQAASEVLAKQGFDVVSEESKLALTVKIERAKRGFVARVQIVERGTKEVVVGARRKFLRAGEAASVGRALGRVLAAGLKAEELDVEDVGAPRTAAGDDSDEPGRSSRPAGEKPAARGVRPALGAPQTAAGLKSDEPGRSSRPAVVERPAVRVVRPVETELEEESDSESGSAASESIEDDQRERDRVAAETRTHRPAAASSKLERPSSMAEGPAQRWLSIGVGLGSQVSSAYAVLVGGETTGLGYALGPAPLFRANVRALPFEVPIALETQLDWAAVRYRVALDGLDVPMTPAGHYFDLRGRVACDLVFGPVDISPKLGLGYRALAVQLTERVEDALVIGSHWVAPEAGVGLTFYLSDAASIEVGAIGRAILGYSEKPVTSGSGGGGFGLTAGASAKYWISDAFALSAGLDYDYASIATEGLGTRPTFRGDPVLENASVLHSELRMVAGIIFAR